MCGVEPDAYYRPREIAALYRISPRWVNNQINAGRLRALHLGRERRILGADWLRFAERFCSQRGESNNNG